MQNYILMLLGVSICVNVILIYMCLEWRRCFNEMKRWVVFYRRSEYK